MILKIEQFLDSRNLVFNYLTSLNRTSLIDADCLIKSTYNNVTAYIFIRKRKENSEYCICSFFVNPSMLYTGEKAYWWYKAKHHIWTINGFVYLTSVMDLFSRKIIAWTLSETLEVSCVIDTINKAKARRNIDQPLIIHSDRGSQYVAKEYKKATENMQRSYSKKAFPWDNACIESFHSIIKREWLNRFKIRDYKQAYQLIFEYLEAFYNTKRIHSHCNYMSPNEFEQVYERTHTEAELLAG